MNAKDLLHKYLDYKCFWSDHYHVRSKPANIRLNQISILLESLGILKANVNPNLKIKYLVQKNPFAISRSDKILDLSELEYFETGEFLHDRDFNENKDLIQKIEKLGKSKSYTDYQLQHFFRGNFSLIHLFEDLLSFRREIFKVTNPPKNIGSGLDLAIDFGRVKSEKLKKLIRENTSEIDEILCLLIDPKKQEISKEELIQKFKYQDVDLKEIDLKYRTENF